MTSANTLPSTLDGLKRYAKNLRRTNKHLTHVEALDEVARMMRFNNFTDAQRQLALVAPRAAPTYAAYLTAYWRAVRVPFPRPAGRETLRVELQTPLTELLKRHEVRHARNFGDFRFEAEDHLERRGNYETQEETQRRLLLAAGTLYFLEATGLRPATRRMQRRALGIEDLPGRDHVSDWVDPQTGAVVALDEPYPHVNVTERAIWLAGHGLTEIAPEWGGLYSPGHTKPYLVARNSDVLHRLSQQVDALARRPARTWDGESGSYLDRFVSPARRSDGKPASARTMPAYAGTVRAGAIAYGGAPGYKGRWRPEVSMPFELHEEASRLLQTTSFLDVHSRATTLVGAVRSELEDWVLAEHRDAMAERFDVYYGLNVERESNDARGACVRLAEILRAGYADCSPRRQMLDRLHRALSIMDGEVDATED